jgi:hypothetical protein
VEMYPKYQVLVFVCATRLESTMSQYERLS